MKASQSQENIVWWHHLFCEKFKAISFRVASMISLGHGSRSGRLGASNGGIFGKYMSVIEGIEPFIDDFWLEGNKHSQL